MSDLESQVRDELRALADDAPLGTDLWEKTQTRIKVRQRRRRHAIAIVAVATVSSLAVAISLGHNVNDPSVTVSPTPSVRPGRSLTPADVTFRVFHQPPHRLPASFLSNPGIKAVPGGFDAKLGARLIRFTPTRAVYLFRTNSHAYCLADTPSFAISCTTAAGLAEKGISFGGSLTPDRKSIDGVGMAPDFVTHIRVKDVNVPIRDNAFRITVRPGDTVIISTRAGDLTMPIPVLARQP